MSLTVGLVSLPLSVGAPCSDAGFLRFSDRIDLMEWFPTTFHLYDGRAVT